MSSLQVFLLGGPALLEFNILYPTTPTTTTKKKIACAKMYVILGLEWGELQEPAPKVVLMENVKGFSLTSNL